MRPTEVKIPFGMVDWTDERDQLRADLDAARREIERLKAFRSGAGSTVWGDRAYVRLFEAAQRKEPLSAANVALLLAEIDGLRADLDAARSEIERLTEQRTANMEASDGYLAELHEAKRDLAHVQSRIAALERVAELTREMANRGYVTLALRQALAALDAAQATADVSDVEASLQSYSPEELRAAVRKVMPESAEPEK